MVHIASELEKKIDPTRNPFALSLSTPSIRTTVELTPKGREKGAFLNKFRWFPCIDKLSTNGCNYRSP
jgi:hypothetical protein